MLPNLKTKMLYSCCAMPTITMEISTGGHNVPGLKTRTEYKDRILGRSKRGLQGERLCMFFRS